MSNDKRLRVTIKYGDEEFTYKISAERSASVYAKVKEAVDPADMTAETQNDF